jgi:prevent-host-death family protein
MTATKVSAMELRNRIGDVLNRVVYKGERFVIERRGRPVAAIVSIEELERLERLEREKEQDAKDLLMNDAEALHALYAEFADEDLELAALGTAHYAHMLRVEEEKDGA